MQMTLVVGERLPTQRLAQALSQRGRTARTWNQGGDPTPDHSVQPLAAALVAFEQALQADRPELVLLADDSDAALAAALVATKLLIPVEAIEGAAAGSGVNARLISQLAATYTLPG